MEEYPRVFDTDKELADYKENRKLTVEEVETLINPVKRMKKNREIGRDFMAAVSNCFSTLNKLPSKPAERNKAITLSEIYAGSVLESIRRDNRLLLNHHFYSSDNHILSVSGYIERSQELEKLPEIIKHDSSETYKKFLEKSERTLSAQLLILQNMVKRYASKNSKEIFRCEKIHLNEGTIKQLIDYYKMDNISGNYLLSFHRRAKDTLADLIKQTYNNLIRDKKSWN